MFASLIKMLVLPLDLNKWLIEALFLCPCFDSENMRRHIIGAPSQTLSQLTVLYSAFAASYIYEFDARQESHFKTAAGQTHGRREIHCTSACRSLVSSSSLL